MKVTQNHWNCMPLGELLTESQEHILMDWLEANKLDENSIEYVDDMLHGFTVYAKQPSTGEWWAIDFVRIKEGE